MTRLEEIEIKLEHLISKYKERKTNPSYRIQLFMLLNEYNSLNDE